MMIGWIVLLLIVVFAAILLIRTLRFTPRPEQAVPATPIALNKEKITQDMIDMIRCRTISDPDPDQMDSAEFLRFQRLLQDRFPLIHSRCTLRQLGLNGLLYHLPGKLQDAPTVCMAHYDVVPVEEDGWSKPAFEGILEALLGCFFIIRIGFGANHRIRLDTQRFFDVGIGTVKLCRIQKIYAQRKGQF